MKDSITFDDKEVQLEWNLGDGIYLDNARVITRNYLTNITVSAYVECIYKGARIREYINFTIVGYTAEDLVLGKIKFTNSTNTLDYITDDFVLPKYVITPNNEEIVIYWYEYTSTGKYVKTDFNIEVVRPTGATGTFTNKFYVPEVELKGELIKLTKLQVNLKIISLNIKEY